MGIANRVTVPSVQGTVSAEEWQVRKDLAAAYRLFALFGWDDIIFTHLSARVPGPEHHFLINPYGWLFDEMTASALVKIDLDGRKVMDSPYEINPAGFTIHSAIHAVREDAQCVMHAHSINGIAVSAQKHGGAADLAAVALRPLVPGLSRVRRRRRERGREAAPRARPGKKHVPDAPQPWPAHGGRDGRGRLHRDVLLRSPCMIQVRAQAGGGELIAVAKPILDGIGKQVQQVTRNSGATLSWPGLLRRLARRNPGWDE